MKNRLLLSLFVPVLTLSACATNVRHEISEYILQTNYHDNYRILQLTDIHLGDKDEQDTHFKFMDLTIKDANPDFIVITGDVFSFASRATAKRLINFFESYKKPWTITFGNHDEQCLFSIDWLSEYMNTKTQYAMYKDILDDNVHGNCNFAINLMQGNKVFEQLIMVDTNRYYYGDYSGYDFVKQDQIDWYSDLIDFTSAHTEHDGAVVPSLMFYHIPLPEVDDAIKYAMEVNHDAWEYGEQNEKTCPPDYNSGFFKRIKEKGSTHAMFFGHDHINNFRITYQDVTFCYGIKSTNLVYYQENMMGGQVIVLHNDHTLGYEHIYHTYKEVK